MRSPATRRRNRSRAGPASDHAVHDHGRTARTGVPEVVLAEGKRTADLLEIVQALRARGLGAIISRPTAPQRSALEAARRRGWPLVWRAEGRVALLEGRFAPNGGGGVVGLMTAGTADVPVAEEIRAILGVLGHRVVTAYDVGVAGIHRTLQAIRRLERMRPSVYLVCAGREGALPTVVAGLVRAPVVGIPTSVGYGRGGRGEAALNAMLQACAPVAVVNIDGGVPAALFASQLLVAQHRAQGARGRREKRAAGSFLPPR